MKASNSAGTATETLSLDVQSPPTQNGGLELFMVPALLLRGNIGQSHTIEWTDAVGSGNWKTAATITLTNQAQFYVDLSATNVPKRFYRATIKP